MSGGGGGGRKRPKGREGDTSAWVPDKGQPRCMVSGASFGLFERKHHCRYSGEVVCGAVSEARLPLPDLRWGDAPQRVADPSLGLPCVEALEDLVLVSRAKSEILAVLDDLKSSGGGRLAVTFGDAIGLRSCGDLQAEAGGAGG